MSSYDLGTIAVVPSAPQLRVDLVRESVVMMDAAEARTTIETIKGHLDHARRLLLDLEEREGWKALGYASWRDCAQAEFGQSQAYLYRQLSAAKIERELDSPIGEIPESHMREVAKAKPANRPRVIERADQLAGSEKRTAKYIAQAREEIEQPDLPVEFAIAQRRFEARGHVLSAAWDGHTQRFVVRKDGGTGVVMLWPDVVSKLARIEAEQDAPVTPPPPTPRPGSATVAAYDDREETDLILIGNAEQAIAKGDMARARVLLDQVEVATWRRDQLLATITAATDQLPITLGLTKADCAALLKEIKLFESSGLTKRLPTISQALLLLVQAIRGQQ